MTSDRDRDRDKGAPAEPRRLATHHPVYGRANPEAITNQLWHMAIDNGWSGYALRQHMGGGAASGATCQGPYAVEAYREAENGPAWSWQRFGQSVTELPDGRRVFVAGEHEDWYDRDFCIYNDVVVEHPDGRRDIYCYPKDVFPPTDFHSATLVGHAIILIGSLGYAELRRPGETQLLRLDTTTFAITPQATSGDAPGWISSHQVERLDVDRILVFGGQIETHEGSRRNVTLFELNVSTWTWQRRQHGDTELFPVATEDFDRLKSPSFGASNPERADNPVWQAMVTRGWTAGRARLHFDRPAKTASEPDLSDIGEEDDDRGDGATAERIMQIEQAFDRARPRRTGSDIVWTALREDTLDVNLPDGRHLMIGGEVTDYGDDRTDPWVYNDVVVTHPDGATEIFTYPEETFPGFRIAAVGLAPSGHVIMIGRVFVRGKVGREAIGDDQAFRLDTTTFGIERLDLKEPPGPINYHGARQTDDGLHLVFWLMRLTNADPFEKVVLNLEDLSWSPPFEVCANPN